MLFQPFFILSALCLESINNLESKSDHDRPAGRNMEDATVRGQRLLEFQLVILRVFLPSGKLHARRTARTVNKLVRP